MTAHADNPTRVPRHVSLFSPLLQGLLKAGIPVGPNALITIRGRKSGEPRTAGVAIIEVEGRRWIWAPWGEVHWVRNLRAAGRATLTRRGREEEVRATELGHEERVAFFRDILGPFARSIPGGMTFVRLLDQTDINNPEGVARDRRVFELHPTG
ncbi:MAG TPA: nitroreductase family deazaflavin-dependent oxidoreductase [Candidatus Limnocylindrales bacterium]|nr:nitroreductase family deazaflavin-dependent oxidoreductase [Candidatus Limnocylindrales bacterium]